MSYPLVPIGKVAEFINGAAFKPQDWGEEGMKIIRIQNLTDKNKPFNRTTRIVDKKYIVTKGDVLVSWSATIDVFVWGDEDSLLNQHIFKVVFDNDKIDKNYFIHALKLTIKELSRYAHGSTMQHVVKKDFDNHRIPLPPLEIQKKIAEILTHTERLLNDRIESIALIDNYLIAVFYKMFGDPVQNEKNWERVPLSKLGSLDRGVSKNRPRNSPELLGGDYPLIQTGEVSNSGLYITEYTQTYSELGLKQSKLWPKGTMLITIAANIAKTSILTFDACFPDSVVGFIPNKTESNTIYVHYLFGFFQAILEKNAPQAAQKNINLALLRSLPVPKPPLELQKEFAEIVDKAEVLRKDLNESLYELENLFGSLNQRAFKGELEFMETSQDHRDESVKTIIESTPIIEDTTSIKQAEAFEYAIDQLDVLFDKGKVKEDLFKLIRYHFKTEYFTFTDLKKEVTEIGWKYDYESLKNLVFELLRDKALRQVFADAAFKSQYNEQHSEFNKVKDLTEQMYLQRSVSL